MTKPSWLPSFLWAIWCRLFPASSRDIPPHVHQLPPLPVIEPLKTIPLVKPAPLDQGFSVEELTEAFIELAKPTPTVELAKPTPTVELAKPTPTVGKVMTECGREVKLDCGREVKLDCVTTDAGEVKVVNRDDTWDEIEEVGRVQQQRHEQRCAERALDLPAPKPVADDGFSVDDLATAFEELAKDRK